MNVVHMKEQLQADPNKISIILEALGLDHITDKGQYFQFPNPDGDNNSACCIYKNTLRYINYTRNKQGDIITLVMDIKSVSFSQASHMIAEWIGCDFKDDAPITLPFGGFYKTLLPHREDVLDTELKVYDQNILPPPACNLRFRKDGISYETQQKFDLRFDLENNSILIPIYNTNNELVGCKARKNEDVVSGKYWAELPFSKTSVVYGLSQNYKSIVSKRKVIIFEAEKSVMQCCDFGCNIAVAVMGHSISKAQARIIKSLMCDEIVIAFDEGVSEYEIKQAASMVYLKNFNKVTYLYGGLPKGSKKSPSDLGKDQFQKLYTQKKTFIQKGED